MSVSPRYTADYPRSNQLLESIEGKTLYPGCRVDLVQAALETFGQTFLAELLGKLSDDEVLQAVERSLELYNAFEEVDDD